MGLTDQIRLGGSIFPGEFPAISREIPRGVSRLSFAWKFPGESISREILGISREIFRGVDFQGNGFPWEFPRKCQPGSFPGDFPGNAAGPSGKFWGFPGRFPGRPAKFPGEFPGCLSPGNPFPGESISRGIHFPGISGIRLLCFKPPATQSKN